MAVDLIWFALATLLAPVFAEYAKIRTKAERQFNFIAAAGIFFLLAVGFQVSLFTNFAPTAYMYGVYLFEFLGWLFLLVGVLWAVFSGLIK
ncbi:MAG: hypothetical protein J7K72_00025 [Candidatus Aenigmarchaeota archaeon]|nr:hypothetical protein [Candidatus Aenigmarchaeota archaeon]